MTKLEFILDKKADAMNRYASANTTSYDVDRSKNIEETILEKIKGKSAEDTIEVLRPILQERYNVNNIKHVIDDLNLRWEKNGSEIFQKMANIVGKPIPVSEVQAKITTTRRCPYSAKQWFFMYSPFRWGAIKGAHESVNIAMHEILHMMLHYYYEDYIRSHNFNDKMFHDLKEAQTVILNEEYDGLFTEVDKGYDKHQSLRKKFGDFWQGNKNFDEFVDYGIEIVKYSSTVADMILSDAEYDRKNHTTPYSYNIGDNEQKLTYIGTNHIFTPNHEQNHYIESAFESFVHQKNPKKIVVTEAQVKSICKDKNENIEKAGESGLLAYLAHQNNIERICPEPSYSEKIIRLEKHFSKDEIFYSECAIRLGLLHRKNEIKTWEKSIQNIIDRLYTLPGWHDIELSSERFKTLHYNFLSKDFDIYDRNYWCNVNNPSLEYKGFTNNISRKDSEEREVSITNNILQKRKEGYDIFVVYGEYHAVVQELALKNLCNPIDSSHTSVK